MHDGEDIVSGSQPPLWSNKYASARQSTNTHLNVIIEGLVLALHLGVVLLHQTLNPLTIAEDSAKLVS